MRDHVETAEEMLDKEFKVLDKGFVRLVDYYGSDDRIVQSARVSYGKGTTTVRKDAALIDYLLRNHHTSPFEQVVFTFHVKMPIFVARQWVRHRTARLNEVSGRYSKMENEFYIPEKEYIGKQSKNNKQGREHNTFNEEDLELIQGLLKRQQEYMYEEYEKLLDMGLAKEIARINLPLSLYTQWYWQMDLNNLFHFLKLRMHSHAQFEIRQYANMIFSIIEKIVPNACKSFEKNILNGVSFSEDEMLELRSRLIDDTSILEGKAYDRFQEKINFAE